MKATKTRVLAAVRQSKTRDRAMSPEVQEKSLRGWAATNGAQVVKITRDLSTSGGLSCFKRKGLGPWLTEPDKIDAWDTLVCTKLDRASVTPAITSSCATGASGTASGSCS